MDIIKNYRQIFVLAILIRLVLMPFLFHPDIKTQYFHAQFLQQGVLNIYQFIAENKKKLGYQDTFNYPPLTYYLLGTWNILMSPLLGPHFYEWLNNWGENGYTSVYIFRFMFILKVPYLILDLLIGVIIAKIVESKHQTIALTIWFFNPITLYVIYGLSNFDIIPTFLTLLALYFYKNQKYEFSGLSLGLGIATKIYPALFIPFFIFPLLKEKKFADFLKFILGNFGIFLVSIVYTWQDFFSISNSGLLSKIFELKIRLGGLQIPWFIICYLILCLFSLLKKTNWKLASFLILTTSLLIDSITQIHPQWLIWGLPFLVIFAVKDLKSFYFIILLIIGYLAVVLSFGDKYLTLGLLSPIVYNIYDVANLEQTIFSKINQPLILITGQLLILSSSVLFLFFNRKVYDR